MNNKIATTRHKTFIDGLRCLAVLAVIANHLNHKILPLGYLGVDVFFVISGYVITFSLESRASKGMSLIKFLSEFYRRRIKRILPALTFYIALISILLTLVAPNPGNFLQTGFYALFGVSNITLYYQSLDYFGNVFCICKYFLR